jgi:integrase
LDGSACHPDFHSKAFRVFREKNNLPPLTFHQLRHTNASLLIAQDVDIATVGKRLGHSTPATTMKIYAHALRRPDREASEKLENMFNKKKKTPFGKQA